MRPFTLVRIALALAVASAALSFATQSRADPLITQGIGISNCAKLAADLKPSAGLDHQANYLLFYWVQGYVSAANFLLLNEYHNYVDMNGVQVATILKLVVDHARPTRTTSRSARSTSSFATPRRSRWTRKRCSIPGRSEPFAQS